MSGDVGLDRADPRVGQTLRFENREWAVTDHSSYWEGDYRVNEWCCESEGTTAYLLKELSETEGTRWFFTRQITLERVTLPGGEALGAHLSRTSTREPPGSLTYDGQTYRRAETTEGTYEDEPGERVSKTTWEYWDAPHAHNLAIERWADGRVDGYHGAYIEPGQVTLHVGSDASGLPAPPGAMAFVPSASRPAAAEPRSTARSGKKPKARAAAPRADNPFRFGLICGCVLYVIPFFLGMPFDRSAAIAVSGGAVIGWLGALACVPFLGSIALLAALVAATVFWRFPPLTSPVGLVALLGLPVALAWWARARGAVESPRAVHYLAGFAVAAPLLALGYYHYFWYAPVPHTLGHLFLALGPSVLGGVAGSVISRLVLGGPSRAS
ncbi:MAG: DUF4178 domain-containing protein [Candidatus Rokuibacteriota bacterium]